MQTNELLVLERKVLSPEFQNDMQQIALSSRFKLNMATQIHYAIDALKKSTQLQKCSEESFIQSIKDVATLGLTLNPKLGQAYLIPRRNVCCADIGYLGMISMLYEYKAAKDVFAYVIYEGDDFEFDFIENKPSIYTPHHVLKKKRGAEIGAFACAVKFDDYKQYVYMPIERIQEIAESTEAYKYAMAQKSKGESSYTIWDSSNRGEMIKKTIIRYLFKMLPKNEALSELGAIMELHDKAHNQDTGDFVPDANGESTKIQAKSGNHAKAAVDRASAKAKPVAQKQGNKTDVPPVEKAIIVIDEKSLPEIFNLFEQDYKLDGRNTRTMPEIKEMEEILEERGFTRDAISERLDKGGKNIKTYEDLLYKGTAEMIDAVLQKILALSKQQQQPEEKKEE